MTQFQTGGLKGKGVADNLFILRRMIDHSKYLGKELWITFYDIEKCFDSLWLEDSINCLWRCGVKDDILYLVFQLNKKAMITVRTPVGNTEPFQINNIVKQGTVLGPVLNNCSLDDNCAEGQGYVMGTVAIKALEFVEDIADLNSGSENAANSNKIIVGIQERKRLTFAAEKCRILKINSFDFSNTVCVKGEDLKVVTQFKYLGDVLNSRGDNSEMIKDRVGKAVGTTNEIISLCKEVNFGKNQISNMLLLYRSIFIPRLIYNCETWTNITLKDYASLRKSQLSFLRRALELPRSVPTAALYLELGILPIKCEIAIRQLLFLKKILDKNENDPVSQVYREMIKYEFEDNWARNVLDLRVRYSLPLNDENVRLLSKGVWKSMVKKQVKTYAFSQLTEECSYNRKTWHLKFETFHLSAYLALLPPDVARVILRARLRMLDLKVNFKKKYGHNLNCPFCSAEPEEFDHIFMCPAGIYAPKSIRSIKVEMLGTISDIKLLSSIGKCLLRYEKCREIVL